MGKKASPQTAVAKTSNASANLPAEVDEFLNASKGMQSGFENVTAKDIIIPRLAIVQGQSPQVVKAKPEYDEDARVGMIWDVALSEGWSKVEIIPLHFVVQYLEWAPRASGKGLVGIHDVMPPENLWERDDKGKIFTKKGGNLIAETAQIYCLNMTADGRPSFIPMASTQLKKSRKLLTYATNASITNKAGEKITPPLYFYSYTLETVPESNADGDWMGWKITPHKPITEYDNWKIRLNAIKGFRDALIRGELRGDLRDQDDAEVAASGSSDNKRM